MLLIIIALILVVMLVITMFIHLEHKFKAIKAIVLLLILLIIGSSVYTWIRNDTNDLNSPKGVANSVYLYAGWMGDIGIELFSTLRNSFNAVGNVIKGNETNIKNPLDGRK